jgi:Peptidase family C25/Propeptide_C25
MKFTYITLIIIAFVFPTLNSITINVAEQQIEISGSFQIQKLSSELINSENFSTVSVLECNLSNQENYEIPIYSKLVALPQTGNFRIQDFKFEYEELQLESPLKQFSETVDINPVSDVWLPQNLVDISAPQIMRGNRFAQISCAAIQYNPARNKIRLITNLDLKFELDHSDSRNPLSSKNNEKGFSKLNQKILGNTNTTSTQGGNYLFIAPEACAQFLQPLLRWKEHLGFTTTLAIFEEIGSNENDVRDFLQNAYDTWEDKPEYVVLVGDVTGSFQMPAFYVEGYLYPLCVTDHTYSLLEGDDYFPDVLIGRLSVQSITELQTIISKIIKYESTPYLGSDWFKSALMVGYVDASNGFSQREVLMGIRDKLLDFEYTKVDTFFAPWQTGQSQLSNEINNGHSFVCYRGAGHSTYWSGPSGQMLTSTDVLNLNNGYMLPMVTSMTCGGGDFAAIEAPTCFGETWMSAGSPTLPKGSIGFIGPSERDTKTWFNNANAMGIFQGVTEEGLFSCGEMLLRGKMELYTNYPNGHAWGGSEESDQFYFYVYNLLGDPGLQIWTDTPKEIELQASEIVVGSNYISASVISEGDKADFTVAFTSEDSLVAVGFTDNDGNVNIPVSVWEGSYQLTASKYGYIPKIIEIQVETSDMIAIANYSFSTGAVSSETIDIELDVKNLAASEATDIVIELFSQNDYISVSSDPINIQTISAGQTYHCQFTVDIDESWHDGMQIDLIVDINSNFGENLSLIPLEILSPDLSMLEYEVLNSSGCIIQNEISSLNIKLLNSGHAGSEAFLASLICLNEAVEIQIDNTSYDAIDIGEESINLSPFSVLANNNIISGETAVFQLTIQNSDEVLDTFNFEIPIGIIDENSATLSDYGYIAIESRDTGNFDIPIYDWLEIDPNFGGPGVQLTADHVLIDGFSKTLNLPFLFRYFDQYYSTITICSDGYISMGESELIFFRNRAIPCGTGPQAMIAPFWDSLVNEKIYAYYDIDNQQFIVEWSDCGSAFNPLLKNSFQVIFKDTENQTSSFGACEIIFQYKEIHDVDANDNFATIGIENKDQTEGIQMLFAGHENPTAHTLENETAIIFTFQKEPDIPYLTFEPSSINVSTSEDTIITQEITLFNNAEDSSELNYTLSLSHFMRDSGRSKPNPNRNIENDFIIQGTGQYVPIQPVNWLFYLVHNSPDGEPVQGITLDFPEGFIVNSATDIHSLVYNGESGNGITATWGYDGAVISPTSPIAFHVNLEVAEGTSGPVEVGWLIEGDGSGAAPHLVEGIITILQSTDEHIWVRYPNGGEKILPGIQDTIRWAHYGESQNVKIEISRDNGSIWDVINASTLNQDVYPYTFTGPLSENCQLRISIPDSDVHDISDSLFQINALNITYPNEITILSYGETNTIFWQDIGGIDFVDIDYSSDNGFSWTNLEEQIANTGFHEFVVPGPPSEFSLIRLTSEEHNVTSYSDQFSVVDSPVNWLTPSETSGSIPAGESEILELQFDTSDLEYGSYQANIRIETEFGQILFVPVTLEFHQTVPPVLEIQLYQNHPNPFNPFTKIEYNLTTESKVKLSVFNVRGQLVKTLVNEIKPAGLNYEYWDGTDKFERPVSSGIYYYLLKAGSKTKAKKMILVK